jgi:hypothetical protein
MERYTHYVSFRSWTCVLFSFFFLSASGCGLRKQSSVCHLVAKRQGRKRLDCLRGARWWGRCGARKETQSRRRRETAEEGGGGGGRSIARERRARTKRCCVSFFSNWTDVVAAELCATPLVVPAMKISVKTLKGNYFDLDVSPSDSVYSSSSSLPSVCLFLDSCFPPLLRPRFVFCLRDKLEARWRRGKTAVFSDFCIS